jgi:hypothetical protein
MTLRQYLILMAVCTLAAWALWAAVLLLIDPESGGLIGVVFFYASLALALTGLNSILGLLVRTRWNKNELISRLAAASFRQAIWFALAVVIALILNRRQILTWWLVLIIVLSFAILEFFFLSAKRRM